MGGTRRLQQDQRLLKALREFHGAGKPLAAVCAGPLVLQSAGLLKGRTVTCHPGVADELTDAKRLDDRVVEDGNLITSQGPGTSFAFALAIVRRLAGEAIANQVAGGLILQG
jgi:4-methyl-5(b-hydroxyethyl)-thiazole monophosphate biosynthesis